MFAISCWQGESLRARKQIGAIGAWEGNEEIALADIFDVAVDGSDDAASTKIIIDGDVPRVKRLGEAMTAGEIVVKGDVDMRCGARMSGGSITVEGNADSWVGREMVGGEILVKGNARLLQGVLNWSGTITIEGDTTLPGGEMKRGTIFVKGKVLEMLLSYKDKETEEVDGVTYRKYIGDLSRNGEGVLYVSV